MTAFHNGPNACTKLNHRWTQVRSENQLSPIRAPWPWPTKIGCRWHPWDTCKCQRTKLRAYIVITWTATRKTRCKKKLLFLVLIHCLHLVSFLLFFFTHPFHMPQLFTCPALNVRSKQAIRTWRLLALVASTIVVFPLLIVLLTPLFLSFVASLSLINLFHLKCFLNYLLLSVSSPFLLSL